MLGGGWRSLIAMDIFLCSSISIGLINSFAIEVSNQSLIFIVADSEKFHEMALATETPPKQCFLLDDDGDFPPIGSTKSD